MSASDFDGDACTRRSGTSAQRSDLRAGAATTIGTAAHTVSQPSKGEPSAHFGWVDPQKLTCFLTSLEQPSAGASTSFVVLVWFCFTLSSLQPSNGAPSWDFRRVDTKKTRGFPCGSLAQAGEGERARVRASKSERKARTARESSASLPTVSAYPAIPILALKRSQKENRWGGLFGGIPPKTMRPDTPKKGPRRPASPPPWPIARWGVFESSGAGFESSRVETKTERRPGLKLLGC